MLWLYISLGIIAGLLLVFLCALYFVYYETFYTPHKEQNNDFFLTVATYKYCDKETVHFLINRMRNYPYVDGYTLSYDKKKLHARIYPNPNSDTVCIMMHGYRGTCCRDFSGGAYDMIQFGFNVILTDERGHGLSEGHSITFGVKEKRDCEAWIKYAKKEFGEDKRIVLVGISMGGATVLFCSDLLNKGDKVIADCPFTTPKEIICETLKSTLHMNPKFFYPIANLASILYGHANLNKDDASLHVKNSKADIMIIHGDSDTIVPYKLSYRLKELYPNIRYELFPKAEHGISYLADLPRYQKIVKEFLESK